MFSCSGTELAANISAVFDEQFTEEKVEAEVSNDDCHLLQTKLFGQFHPNISMQGELLQAKVGDHFEQPFL